ncbi:MAG: 30S ribosomal protein S16 [Candidatus Margulisiibacteriota bacterium]
MAVRLRLKRLGSKKRPVYRLVAAEGRNPRNGKTVDEFGFYNPGVEPAVFDFDRERAQHWLKVGAQPSETVQRLFAANGLSEKVTRTSKEPGVSRKEKKARAAG